MDDQDRQHLDDLVGRLAAVIADWGAGVKAQTVGNTGTIVKKLDEVEKKMNRIIALLEEREQR